MCLSEQANVSENTRRILDNMFFTHHPFKRSSGQLEDLISIYRELRELPPEDFDLCIAAINKCARIMEECPGCYGKGLALLKFLTNGVNEKSHKKYARKYREFFQERQRDCEGELLAVMRENGVFPR
jgi:hypothetical protein